MPHQLADEEPPASTDGPSNSSSNTETESTKKAQCLLVQQQPRSGLEGAVNAAGDAAIDAATPASTTAPAPAIAPTPSPVPTLAPTPTPVGHNEEDKSAETPEVGQGGSASASASASATQLAPTPTGHKEDDKGTEKSEVDRGGGAVRGGKRPPRPPGSIRQARRNKRKAGWEAKKALVKEQKRAERERREESMREAGVEIPAVGTNYRDLPRDQWSVSQKIRNAKREEFEALSQEGGYRVCIDMAFDDLMVEKARASLVQQILYLYGANRKATQPCLVTLSGMGPVMEKLVKRLQGFDTWLGVTTDARCYTEVFQKEELVYLTADSPNTITQLEKGKVYILGGLVDRNAHKGLCFRKGTDHGIATAKLPLRKGDLCGTHSKVLATNHVFDILVRAMSADGDLQKIEHQTLPPRKRAGWTGGDDRGPSSKPKEKLGKNPDGDDKSSKTPESGEKSAQIPGGGEENSGNIPEEGGDNSGRNAEGGDNSCQFREGGGGAAAACNTDGDTMVVGSAVGAGSASAGGAGVCESDKAGAEAEAETAESHVVVEGATNTQAGSHPAGGEQASKNKDDVKAGDGIVDAAEGGTVEGKRTAPEAGLDVDAKRAKTVDGNDVA